MAAMRTLCRLEDIPDGQSRGFPAPPGGFIGLFGVRRGAQVFVYVNACPHVGLPLDWQPDRFLTTDASRIVCAVHGAEFAIDTGRCLRGPCAGDWLQAVPVTIEDGAVLVAADAGL